MKTWTKIAQANLDHYNANPARHNTQTAVYGVAAAVVFVVVAKRLTRNK